MINFNLPGASNPAAAKARSIARYFHAKQASREYDAYCAKKGIPEAEAQLLTPGARQYETRKKPADEGSQKG